MEGRRRVKEQLKKLAAHDYAKTAFSYIERDTGREVWVEVPEQPEEAPVEQAIEEEQAIPQSEQPTAAVAAATSELIACGRELVGRVQAVGAVEPAEGRQGSGARAHGRQDRRRIHERPRRHSSHRRGRRREVVGVEPDYRTIAKGGRDRFENWLTTLFETNLGKPAATQVSISFEDHDGHELCRVDVEPSAKPVYVTKGNSADLYVRINNSTRLLNTSEAVDYIAAHWRR